MKKLFTILMLGVIGMTYSQKTLSTDYAYTASEPYKVIDADYKFYISKGDEVLTVKFDGKKIFVQRFDGAKPAMLNSKLYENFFPKNYVAESVKIINDRCFVFYSLWDGDNKKEQLFMVEVDFKKGEFIGTPQLIMKVDGKVTGSYSGRMMDFNLRDKFDVLTSHDQKSVLIKYRKRPEVKNDKESYDIIGLGTFDSNMKNVSVKEIPMPYTERRMNNLDYQIDAKGNLYMLTKVFHDDSNDDKKKKKDEEANYHIELFTIKSGSDKITTTKIENKDKFINSLVIFDTPVATGLVAGGYYSNGKGKNYQNNCDGVMTFKMKEDGSVTDQYYYEIPLELLNEYESAKTKRKNERKEEKGESAKFTNLSLRSMIVLADGSIAIAGEQYFTVTRTVMVGSSMRTTITYHYNDILVTKINPDGKLAWMKKIPKEQSGSNGMGGMSFRMYDNANDIFVVFLDNVKNFELPVDKTPARHTDGQGGYLTCVRIASADGSNSKGSIFNARDVEDFKLKQFSTNRILQTNGNTFLVEAYKGGKEDIMVKVVLK